MKAFVTRAVLDRLRAEAERAFPNECCGILEGSIVTREFLPIGWRIDGISPAGNVAADPRRRFEIDPQALVDAHRAARAGGPGVIGYYHSHPTGAAQPSPVDRADAARDGRVWAIVGTDGVTFWRDGEERFEPLSYAIDDG